MHPKFMFQLLKESATEWIKDKAPRLSAALAYYTLFSLAPLLVIVISIAGFVFDDATARQKIAGGLGEVLGPTGQKGMTEMIANASNHEKTGVIATIIGTVTLLLGASGVFGQLKDALNTIWEVPKKEGGGVLTIIKDRFLSFTMVLGVGFLLLISLVVTAAIAAIGERLMGGDTIAQVITNIVSLGVVAVAFAALFKYLPDKKIAWSDVWVGAFFTSVLFGAGKLAIAVYLGKSTVGNSFGAAASLAILLVWLYYSGMIFFFGAEFTEVHARAKRNLVLGENDWKGRPRAADSLHARSVVTHPEKRTRVQKPPVRTATAPAPNTAGRVAVAGAVGLLVGTVAGCVGVSALLFKGLKKIARIS